MSALESGLEELVAGRGSVFLITGEPGIGKTRLADELGRLGASRGVPVHWGRAWEAGGAPSYWPFVQVLRSMCRGLDADAVAGLVGARGVELAELVPELRQWVPSLAFSAAHGTSERFQLFDAVSMFLHAVARKAPQIVVLDDLHATDPTSLLLLHFVVRDLRSAPLLIVGTYRDAEARLAPEVGRTLTQVAREATVIPLRRLDAREVADFVAQATGAAPSADRATAIHQRTEGNPLFVHELLRLRGSDIRPPEGIREVVRARLSLLTPVVRRALEAAAVLGREFAEGPLATVAGVPERELRGVLEPAADAGIVEPLDASGRWRFTHVLLREALYEDLSFDRRTALHAAAAAELGRRAGGPPLAELAHHVLSAVPAVSVGDAVEATLRAAALNMSILAFEDAGALLTRAAKLVEGAAGEERRAFEVLLALGFARIRAGEVELGTKTCWRAAEIARDLGDGEGIARAVLGSTYEFTPGVRDATLIAWLEEALAALPPGDGALRARCLAQLAAERQPEPDTQPPIDLARAAVAMARRVDDADALRLTLASASMAMLVYADPEERMAVNQEVLRLALAAGDTRVALRAHLFLANDFWELGDRAGAEPHLNGYGGAREARHSRFRWVHAVLRSQHALWDGSFEEAERLRREAEELVRDDQARGAALAASPLGFCRAVERYEDVATLEAGLRAAFATMPHELGGCIGEMLIAQLHGRLGDRVRSATQLATVRAHPLFARITEASWLALLVEPVHLVGDAALAARIYPALLPRAHRFFNLGPLGPSCEPPYGRQLGLLAQTMGKLGDAVLHLEDAESRTVRAGMRCHLGRLRYELAGVLLERAGPGDRERAGALLAEARVLAETLGQTALLPLVEARAREAAPKRDARAPAPAPAPRSDEAAPSFTLRREGDYWTLAHGSRTLRLRDSRGMQLLDQLVTSPGQELHVLQLVSPGDERGDAGDAGALLDPEAVQSYRRRLLDLREELEEAEGFADAGRADRARQEIDVLTQELARAVGLGQRERRAGGAAERARTAVQKRLRAVIRRIEDDLPDLGRHLDQTIRTGIFCGYLPLGRARGRPG